MSMCTIHGITTWKGRELLHIAFTGNDSFTVLWLQLMCFFLRIFLIPLNVQFGHSYSSISFHLTSSIICYISQLYEFCYLFQCFSFHIHVYWRFFCFIFPADCHDFSHINIYIQSVFMGFVFSYAIRACIFFSYQHRDNMAKQALTWNLHGKLNTEVQRIHGDRIQWKFHEVTWRTRPKSGMNGNPLSVAYAKEQELWKLTD